MKKNSGMKKHKFVAQLGLVAMAAAAVTPQSWAGRASGGGKSGSPAAMPDMSKLTSDDLLKRGAQKSPFEACKGVMLVEDDAYKKNKAFWEKYSSDCKDKATVQTMPSTGMFKSFSGKLGDNLSGMLTANAFLSKVGDRAVKDLTQGINDLKNLKNCANDPSYARETKVNCSKMKEDFLSRIRAEGPAFRKSLAYLTHYDSGKEMGAFLRKDHKFYMNSDLRVAMPGVVVASGQGGLKGAELAEVNSSVKGAYDKAIAEYSQVVEDRIAERKLQGEEAERERKRLLEEKNVLHFVSGKMSELKGAKHAEYLRAISRAPQLAYLSSESPSEGDYKKALDKMISDAEQSLKESKEALESGSLSRESDKMDKNLLRFAGYTAVIEKVLAEENAKREPTSCAVATAVLNELSSVKGQAGVTAMVGLITLPMGVGAFGARGVALLTGGKVALSSTAAVATATAMGIAGGSLLTAHDMKVAETSERNFKTGLTKYEDAKDDINGGVVAAVTSPLNLIGAKAVIGGVAGLAGWATARGVSAVRATNRSMKELEQLVKAAKAGDQNAIAEIAKIEKEGARQLLGGRDAIKEEDELVNLMGQKGLLGSDKSPDVALVREIGDATKDMSAADRKAFALALKNTFEKLNALPKNATAAQKKEFEERARLAAKVGLGFARNGQKDVTQVAKLLNDKGWSKDSLAGVDKVLSQGRASYQSKLKAGLTPEAARSESTLDAISELKFGKPYAALDDAAKSEVRPMCECVGMCAVSAHSWLDGTRLGFPAEGNRYEVCALDKKSDTLRF